MLALGKFIGRQEAHDLVHQAAMQAIDTHIPFADVLKGIPSVTQYLDGPTIDNLLDPLQYTGLSAAFVDVVLANQA
jgi:3-carboxy-cis,cis-muconate cycloisomerase